MSIAVAILEGCRDAVKAQGGGRIEHVRLAIGELAAVEPDLVEFAWQAVIADTVDQDAQLEIEWRPARQHCVNCDQEKQRRVGTWLPICPDCGEPLMVEGGDELDILQITFVTDDESEET